jgi:hypothetical protein
LSVANTSLAPIGDFTKHLFDVSRECQTLAVQRWYNTVRSNCMTIERVYHRMEV